MCAPLIGAVGIGRHLEAPSRGVGIEQVICGDENYDDPRPCDFSWVRTLSEECRARDVTFAFIETDTNFVKDGRRYRIPRHLQSEQALRSGVEHAVRPLEWHLADPWVCRSCPASRTNRASGHVPYLRQPSRLQRVL